MRRRRRRVVCASLSARPLVFCGWGGGVMVHWLSRRNPQIQEFISISHFFMPSQAQLMRAVTLLDSLALKLFSNA